MSNESRRIDGLLGPAVEVALPAPLFEETEGIFRAEGRWLSVVDFARFACGNEVERQRGRARKPAK